MSVHLSFHGAAGCVTGSCARLETGRSRVLVDCGMFQGPKSLKALNYERFPFDPREVDAVLLTHAHIDHSGLLPKLTRAGFRGRIFATPGTRELCEVMLADAAHIQESEVRQLNRRNERRGRPAVEPIYRLRDAAETLELFEPVRLGERVQVAPGVTATFWEAGHILGSASVSLEAQGEEGPVNVLFSGDLGPGGRDFMPDPKGPAGVGHLVLESTYGGRERPALDPAARRRELAQALRDAHRRGGPALVPAFAVERSQELLADIQLLEADGEIPPTDIFLDSPLAIEATEVFVRHGWNAQLGRNPFEELRAGGRLQFLREPWESDRLEKLAGWHIIMAASGMCEAGRIRKHLKRLLWRRDASVLLPGFQAVGTLGRILADGARQVTIQGEEVHVRAHVQPLDIYSGHADATGLAAWAAARRPVAGQVFLNHGEPDGLAALRDRLVAGGFAPERIAIPEVDARYRLLPAAVEPDASGGAGRRLPPAAAARPDWHNRRVELLMDLDARLDALGSDAEREALLAKVAKALAPTG